jgi:formiminotetrahydrofolate cyclodeaminase
MEVCLEAMHITQALAPIANKNIISDLGISVILFEAAAQSAWLTVEINRVSLKDPVLRNEYEHKCNAIISEITGIKNHTVKLVRQRIAQ